MATGDYDKIIASGFQIRIDIQKNAHYKKRGVFRIPLLTNQLTQGNYSKRLIEIL